MIGKPNHQSPITNYQLLLTLKTFKMNYSLKNIYKTSLLLLIGMVALSSGRTQIQFNVTLLDDGETYQAALRPNVTLEGTAALTNSAQLTFVVPSVSPDAPGFIISDLQSINGEWANNSISRSPTENPNFDYLSVGLTSNGTANIPYTAGETTVLFTFKNSGNCTGALNLIETNDPFLPPNSENVNVGNEITVFGLGSANAWTGNFGQGQADCPLPDCLIEYKVELLDDGITYQVSLRSALDFTGLDAVTNSAQVTLLVPSGSGSSGTFTISNLNSVNGMWANNTNIIAPSENPNFDYLIIGLTNNGTDDIPYSADSETVLFTFENGGFCTGPVELMEANDPFFPPNSQNINAGNEIVLFGAGNQNAWCGNYGQGSAVCPQACAIQYTLALLDDGKTYQVSLRSLLDFEGIDALTNSAQVTLLAPSGGFLIENVNSITGEWANNTNVLSPMENADFDYFIFGLTNNGTDDIPYVAGEEVPLFTFENAGFCTGPLELMETGDPFEPPNSVNINASNEIVVFGAGNQNAWCGNYGQGNTSCPMLNVAARVFLQGAFNTDDGLMNDQLRTADLLPTLEPYSTITITFPDNFPFTHIGGGGGEMTQESVFAVSDSNAIVDWVFLELRAAADSAQVIATRSALLQRDGDVVDMDGISPVQFPQPLGDYFLSIRHRNHLGVMTANALNFGTAPSTIDFTNPDTPIFGTHAQKLIGGVQALWAGDTNADGAVIFQGENTDLQPIFFFILNEEFNPELNVNFEAMAYDLSDTDLNGIISYQGMDNDVAAFIFFNVLLHPDNTDGNLNYIIFQQLPD